MSISATGLSLTRYQQLRAKYITQVEGKMADPYVDTDGYVTIGIGFNLHPSSGIGALGPRSLVFESELKSVGLASRPAEAAYLSALGTIFNEKFAPSSNQSLHTKMQAVKLPPG